MKSTAVLALLATAALSRADWDIHDDFSYTANPNGVWSYGSTTSLGGAFTAFTLKDNIGGFNAWHSTEYGGTLPLIGINVTGMMTNGVPAGRINIHPGTSLYADARFSVPSLGIYSFSGSFGVGDIGAVDVHILKNGISLFEGADGASFSLSQVLATGDKLDFVVGNAGNVLYDSTPLEAHITVAPVPEPASFAALGLGALVLIRRRRTA